MSFDIVSGVVRYKKDGDKMNEYKDVVLDNVFKAFLKGQKKITQFSYGHYLKRWVAFSKMNGQESLDFKKNDTDAKTEKLVIAFQQWIKDQGLSDNSAKTGTGCVRGFYASNRMPLVFIKGERKRLADANRNTEDYLFSREDLIKMNEQASLAERYILVVGKSIGLRAGDFLSITYGQLRTLHLDAEAPLSLGEIHTKKEKVKAYPFIDSDCLPIIKSMLERHPEAKDSDRILDYKDEQPLTLCLKRLFDQAHLVHGEKIVRFHNLRKYLIDRLSAVASESQWKQIVGKKISEGAYVSTDQLREVYSKAMPSIIINGHSKNNVVLEAVQKELTEMKRLNKVLLDKLEALTVNDAENKTRIDQLYAIAGIKKEKKSN